ncbi:hypothetical protein [Streptomyces sp. NPDC093094]|uniref:phosphorylase family protein n=1 Tax=Streptomyces sp. NPDC093094 TaxID=3366026 RepID=UPI00381509B4
MVLTALDLEFDAVESRLAGVRRGPRDDIGTRYRMGWVDGTPWQVALAEIGPGNDGAAVVTAKAVQLFAPRLVMFVGVAGGLKDSVELGDVVVATKVYAVHGGKEEAGAFRARPDSWQLAHDLAQLAMETRRGDWAGTPGEGAGDPAPRVHLKPVAAGEVVLNSSVSSLRDQLRDHYEDAVAIEMESAGMTRAAHMSGACPAVTVRGISDKADGRKHDADRHGGQSTAARRAAAFALGMIRRLDDPGRGRDGAAADDVPARPRRPDPGGPRPRPPGAGGWSAGEVVDVAGTGYLLQEEYLARHVPAGGTVREFSGRALRVGPAGARGRPRFVWLRRVEAVDGGDRAALAALSALRRENDLLGELAPRPGLPAAGVHRTLGPRGALLCLPWPAAGHRAGGPAPTLSETYGQSGPLPGSLLYRALPALAGLADALDVLHRAGFAHRCLDPAAVLVVDGGALRLRDLGLAFRRPEPGEGPEAHRAPEQWHGDFRSHLVGAPTDVRQAASLVYRLISGVQPETGAVVPVRVYAPAAPPSLERVLRAALDPDPAARPTAAALADGLRRSAADLRAAAPGTRTAGPGAPAGGAPAC